MSRGVHIDFGADSVGVGLGVTLPCLHSILCTSDWIPYQIFMDL